MGAVTSVEFHLERDGAPVLSWLEPAGAPTVMRYATFANGAFGGLGGAFFAAYLQNIYPSTYSVTDSIYFMLYCFLGGLDFIFGAVAGAFLLVISFELLHDLQAAPAGLVGARPAGWAARGGGGVWRSITGDELTRGLPGCLNVWPSSTAMPSERCGDIAVMCSLNGDMLPLLSTFRCMRSRTWMFTPRCGPRSGTFG